ncbi:MFS transporter [Lysobacter sp. K5869]|uniref:MFS transporter n=1 Tax=Lysobacter sp. K5869 TaxID=2820808 RepID=UPI001C061722|nr:MFS transporter [Lysobacter sp. K5869]QWP75415.1 MFS transporter [Lysobacter sp. K5869]
MSTNPALASCPAAPPLAGIERGTAAYRRANFALFLAGCSTFSLLYCVQPLLPEFARDFGLSPANSSLALSLSTAALALAIFAAGALSQQVARRRLMFVSMALAAACNVLAAVAPSWPLLLLARLAEGAMLGGVPAVAMAYLAEEMDARHLSSAMGLYVAGTAFGGMMGRVGMGALVELGDWRAAMAIIGGIGLAAAFGFAALLPPSRRFVPQRGFVLQRHLRAWGGHLRHPGLLRLFALGFVLACVFVALFNYVGFRLAGAPYRLGPGKISLIFLAYVFGMFSSPLAGRLADRFGGRWPLLAGIALMMAGALTTLGSSLVAIVAGISLLTFGFFVGHSVASAWVGRLAGGDKSHASSLYLLFYYFGSSMAGPLGGWAWQHGGWGGEVSLTASLAAAGIVLALQVEGRGAARGG